VLSAGERRGVLKEPFPCLVGLGWSILFLIVANIAAVFGFGGIAAAATDIARLLFAVFLVLFVISLLLGWRSTSPPL
jgi:uncharacterized membrane protein YtjA (UPF0391 family)